MHRRQWPLRDYPSVVWLVAAVVVSMVHRWVPSSTWLMIHMVLLGALTHAILVWSRYFTDALLKVPATAESRRDQSMRITMVMVGAALVMTGVPSGLGYLVAMGATLVGLAVC